MYSVHNSYLLNINKLFLYFIFLYLFTFKGIHNTIWWQHFKISNFNLSLVLLLLTFNLFFLFICQNLSLVQNFVKLDYFFALLNLSNFLPLIFIVNTLFTFLFVLEFVSVIIFYKFVVSKL